LGWEQVRCCAGRKKPVKEMFCPSSVVVIGVSTRWFNLGKEIARNLLEFEYDGVIHLVGKEGGVVFGRKIHTSLAEIPDPIDLAIILIPAKAVPDVMEECGRKGIKRVIIETGGFGEFDRDGQGLGTRLKEIAQRYGMRFIGPNCIGIMNAANGMATPFARMNNIFRRGGVGIIAQSGGVALLLLNMLDNDRIGYSKFAAIGNKLNVDECDVLEYYLEDPDTNVVCLYLESISDGRRLTNIGRSSTKPIVVHKANIGAMSTVIAHSHTEALANDDQVVDAALRQVGMVRFRDMPAYMDFVKILQLPRMKGRNLAIVSRSGGHAVMAADAAYTYGFKLPPFRQDFLDQIRKHLRAQVIQLTNPLDLGDLFDFEVYCRIIEHTLQQDTVDGILFLHTYFAGVEGEPSRKLLQSVAELSQKYQKPVAVSVSTEQFEMSRLHKEFDFPIFLSPGTAIESLDRSINYYERREFIAVQGAPAEPDPLLDHAAIQAVLDRAAQEKRSPLLHEALQIVGLAGIQVPQHRIFAPGQSPDFAARDMPGPYALKIVSAGISHKSDVGGVVLGLADASALSRAYEEMTARVADLGRDQSAGVLVQQMAPKRPGSYELILGGKRDPQFGPIVLLGHGGVFVEVFGKAVLRMAPLCIPEIDEMIDELPGSEILRGVRGLPPVDMGALREALVRLSYLMVHFPAIDQIDINPALVSSSGVVAVDARIVLG
jgi:acetyltransferase